MSRRATASLAWVALTLGGCGGADHPRSAASATGGPARGTTAATAHRAGTCALTRVHYEPRPGVQPALRDLPWIAPEPAASGAVGHLFYYAVSRRWWRHRVPGLRIWTGGRGPVPGTNTKILWTPYGKPIPGPVTVRGERIDSPAHFSQRLESLGPSIIDVPAPGCWHVTLQTESGPLRLTLRAVRPR